MKNTYSKRQQRVATLINGVLVKILQEGVALKDYTGTCPVTITKVVITPDLRLCNCYFLPFNTNLSVKQLQNLLDNSRFMIRKIVTDEIELKYSPEIKFFHDIGYENTNKVEEILKTLKNK